VKAKFMSKFEKFASTFAGGLIKALHNLAMTQTMTKPIAILSAMEEEQRGMLALLRGRITSSLGGRDVHVGTINDQPVVLALSRIGKVAAATTATSLILKHNVGAMLFTGVAGGLAEHVNVGDVVIATALLQHDMDASPLFPKYEIPLVGQSRFETDAALTARVRAASAALAPRLHEGLIVSGDQFVATGVNRDALRRSIPDALAVEMEGAAVTQVCHDFNIPCAIVRTISDRADDTAHHDFATFIQNVATVFSVALVRKLLA
jgi:adenosylhomocysteine nucleosidase